MIKDSLIQIIESSRTNKSFNDKDTLHINRLNLLSQSLRFYNADSLLKTGNQALALSTSIDYTKGKVMALRNIAYYHTDKSHFLQSIEIIKNALSLANKSNQTRQILSLQNQLANLYIYQGKYSNALKEYLKGLEIAKKVKDQYMLSLINGNIALIYADQKNYEQALKYFEIVLDIIKDIGDDNSIAFTEGNMASLYSDMGNYDKALSLINRSIAVYEKNESLYGVAFGYQVKGDIYLKQDKFEWANFWFKQCQSLHDNLVEDQRNKINLLNGLAGANLGLNKDRTAEQYALSANALSKELNNTNGILKSSEILYKINKKKKDYRTALSYHESFQKLSDTLIKIVGEKNLLMLETKMNHDLEHEELIVENAKALAKQKNYVYASLGILLILVVITLLIRRSENIQKRLNKELQMNKIELENNESELKAINETKDKMFSIIGHDLRGPIGAFQGLLKLFQNKEIEQSEFLQFVPKLRSDIDNISFTLNNLLSWGQTQLNGTITRPSSVSLANLVEDNINLLSEIANKKSIKMISRLKGKTLSWSDSDQMDIVLRNLISNALKFTPKNGMVTIDSREDNKHWEISVRDTGIGIDEETRNRLFQKNSNITTYGTDNEKGTGLGLTLCKEMVENNGGEIWVESISGRGTSFYFTVPKSSKTLQQAS